MFAKTKSLVTQLVSVGVSNRDIQSTNFPLLYCYNYWIIKKYIFGRRKKKWHNKILQYFHNIVLIFGKSKSYLIFMFTHGMLIPLCLLWNFVVTIEEWEGARPRGGGLSLFPPFPILIQLLNLKERRKRKKWEKWEIFIFRENNINIEKKRG